MKEDRDKFARSLAQEVVAALKNSEKPRTRRIDWPTIIVCAIAVSGVIWAVFVFCIDAKLAPYDKRASLIEQSQKHMAASMESGLKRINAKIDMLMGATAGVTPEENNFMESGNSFWND